MSKVVDSVFLIVMLCRLKYTNVLEMHCVSIVSPEDEDSTFA
jgi:hypothetical protein